MTNFFLEELRKIYGDGRVIHDPQFVGECCYGSIGDLRVKAQFTKDIIANQYPYLTVSILNPTKGEIDSVQMKIVDVVSRSCHSTNPNLRNTEPHIWVDGKTPQWYACCPGSRDYTLLAGNSHPQKGRFRQQAEYIVWGSNGDMPVSRPVPCLPGVFKYGNPQNRIHLTEKPLQLMQDLVKITEPGGHILDPFAGSGTTVLAAVKEGYDAIGIEVTDVYADLARKRLEAELNAA